MFNSFLEGTRYYDYPSFEVALFSLLLSLVLSTVIAYTYRYTVSPELYSRSFFQAMVLSALVTSMIMMAVGNNLAVGFGIIGAVAIIRFRTNIQNPRNVIFIFAALSAGIASGVYGYAVAIAGTIIFTFTAFLLFYSHGTGGDFKFEVSLRSSNRERMREVKQYLKSVSRLVEESELRMRDEGDNQYEFVIYLKANRKIQDVFQHLQDLPELTNIKITKKPILIRL